MSFENFFNPDTACRDWEEAKKSIYSKTSSDVEAALSKNNKRTLGDFMALVSPAAALYLEEIAQLSRHLTQKRFGKTIQLYVPLYLSNECRNICTYCGFSYENKIPRRTLTDDEILKEVAVLKAMNYDHVLLVTGEANKTVGVPYLANAIKLIRPYFSNISLEVQPMGEEEYRELISLGVYAVLVYQETYNRKSYSEYHLKGRKSNFSYRLHTPERLGRAKVHKIGLGVLLGLNDWRTDSFFCAMHLNYLEKNFWQTKYSVSFPRLRPYRAANGNQVFPRMNLSDRDLTQLICAYRIFNEEAELSLSTRENPIFRDNIIKLGITSVSAGSKTNPGGYAIAPESLEQFEINDERSAQEISSIICSLGYEPVWKDWDRTFQSSKSKISSRNTTAE